MKKPRKSIMMGATAGLLGALIYTGVELHNSNKIIESNLPVTIPDIKVDQQQRNYQSLKIPQNQDQNAEIQRPMPFITMEYHSSHKGWDYDHFNVLIYDEHGTTPQIEQQQVLSNPARIIETGYDPNIEGYGGNQPPFDCIAFFENRPLSSSIINPSERLKDYIRLKREGHINYTSQGDKLGVFVRLDYFDKLSSNMLMRERFLTTLDLDSLDEVQIMTPHQEGYDYVTKNVGNLFPGYSDYRNWSKSIWYDPNQIKEQEK